MKDNTAHLILGSLLHTPSKPLLGDDNICLTRSSFFENVRAQAEQFLSSGLKADEFVILMCDRGISFWIELLAAWIIGAKPVCVEAKISDEHAAALLKTTGTGKIVGVDHDASAEFVDLQRIPSTFDPARDTDNIRYCFDALPFAKDKVMPEMAGLIFTSGTTGLPKAVPLTHWALNFNALSTAQRLNLRSSDRLMIATPFRFISSISHFLVTLLSGASFFGIERTLMVKDLMTALNDLDITAFGGSPFHMQFVAMAGDARLPNLRWVMSSGDHLRPAVIEQLSNNFKDIELHVVYGMAELGGRFCELPPKALPVKSGSVGFPINGFEMAIRRDDGSHCDIGEIGNIFVAGQLGFRGYYRNEQANNKVLGPKGFLNGDKGYFDEDGYLFLSGRSDSVFKRSGLKVSAQVISDALMSLDGVKDAFSSSEENALEGLVPVAYVSWEKGGEMESQELTRALRNMVPVNHIPIRYVSMPVIPRTGSGKVDRRKLANLIKEAEQNKKTSE